MGVRRYDPSAQRFFQLDQLGTRADLALASDPLTQNRYDLAASNPLGAIEWDGHVAHLIGGDDTGYVQPGYLTRGFMAHAAFGSFSDFVGGAANTVFGTFKASAATSTFVIGAPQLGTWASSHLPARIPLANPATPASKVGTGIAFAAGLLIPGGDEADAADLAALTADTVKSTTTANTAAGTAARITRFETDSTGVTIDRLPPLRVRMRLPDGSVTYGFRPGGGGAWQWIRPRVPLPAGTVAHNSATIAEEGEYGLAATLRDPQNVIDAGDQAAVTIVDPFLPPSAVTPGYSFGDVILMPAVAAELAGRALGG